MSVLRGLLLENLGLKLAALLLAVLVYLNVYLDRPADMVLAFPVELDDLADTLALQHPAPASVMAELRGSGKQLLRLKLTEPTLKLSLAGQGPGRFHRAIVADDLPTGGPDGAHVTRLIGPATVDLDVERRVTRGVPVAARVVGTPAAGWSWPGAVRLQPARLDVSGPRSAFATLDSVRLQPVRITNQQDTVRVEVEPAGLPDGCTTQPASVRVVVPLARAARPGGS
ncbi:MAG TPA: YbbR-like domain-containing protein [Candidatus Eisenbacteria bacterium]|nr:YbbR-like domain-containing protein [Candidatus Eisenbacteria bacterium]